MIPDPGAGVIIIAAIDPAWCIIDGELGQLFILIGGFNDPGHSIDLCIFTADHNIIAGFNGGSLEYQGVFSSLTVMPVASWNSLIAFKP